MVFDIRPLVRFCTILFSKLFFPESSPFLIDVGVVYPWNYDFCQLDLNTYTCIAIFCNFLPKIICEYVILL